MSNYYLYLGKEEGLKDEALTALIKKAKKALNSFEIKKYYANDKKDILMFISTLSENSLFGEKFFHIVYNTDEAGAENLKKISSILKQTNDDELFVVFLSNENKITSVEFNKLFPEDHKKIFYEMFENQKVPFIQSEAKKRGLTIDTPTSEFLLSLKENTTKDLKEALDDIQRILEKSNDKKVDENTILSVVNHSKEENGFTICYHIAKKNKQELLNAVEHYLIESAYILPPLFASLLFSLIRAESVMINRENGIRDERAFTIIGADGNETTIRSPFEKTTINAFISNYKRKDVSLIIKKILDVEYQTRNYDQGVGETLLIKTLLSLF